VDFLGETAGVHFGVLVDGGFVYYGSDDPTGAIFRSPVSGARPEKIFGPILSGPIQMVMDSKMFYYVDGDRLMRPARGLR
jgi:hypothetical protein